MADRQDAFAQVRNRMHSLMREQPSPVRQAFEPRLEDMIYRLGLISASRHAA